MSRRTLPIDVRPRVGESVEGYIRRLARANHLRPSYLYQYLCTPQYHGGTLQPELLAQITGRPLSVLERVLPSLRLRKPATPLPPPRRFATGPERIRLYAAIRRDAETGYSIRALAALHHVHCRTVRHALTSLAPPQRKQLPRRRKTVDHVRPHVDALIAKGLTARAIWEKIFDDHDTGISYSSIRTYVSAQREREAPHAQP
jgi:hypothetical protein